MGVQWGGSDLGWLFRGTGQVSRRPVPWSQKPAVLRVLGSEV